MLLVRQSQLATITPIDTQPLQEAETMLETNILKWKQDLIYQGYADGEAKGKAEGKAEGEAKGKAEGWKTAQKTIAKTMKGLNLPLATIAVATGLTEAEIQDL
jgi:predicted transposase/invertase (TIGR01784 family)